MVVRKKVASSPSHSFSLTAHDFITHERNYFWYIGIGLLLATALLAALWFHDYWSALLVVAIGVAIFRLAHLEPTKHEVTITTSGLQWGNHFFPYHQLRAFWVNSVEGRTTFHIDRLNFNAEIAFVVPDTTAEKIFDHLLSHLPWHHDRAEPVGDWLGRWFKL